METTENTECEHCGEAIRRGNGDWEHAEPVAPKAPQLCFLKDWEQGWGPGTDTAWPDEA